MAKLTFNFDAENLQIDVFFPLTSPTGNVRVRKRDSNNKYGYQVYKNDIKDCHCYIDWQIEYDTKKQEESYSNIEFVRTVNGDHKFLYCLSDFIKFFYENGIITNNDLNGVLQNLNSATDSDFIISNPSLITKQFRGGLDCCSIALSQFTLNPYSTVFPLYLISLANNIDVEIGLFEGGFATSSLMPHLYICIPFTKLENFRELNRRPSNSNDNGKFVINRDNIAVFLKIFHLIGLLTPKHKSDVIDIINSII